MHVYMYIHMIHIIVSEPQLPRLLQLVQTASEVEMLYLKDTFKTGTKFRFWDLPLSAGTNFSYFDFGVT